MEKDSNEFNQTYTKLGIVANDQVGKDAVNILADPGYQGVHGKEVRFDILPNDTDNYSVAYICNTMNIPTTKGFQRYGVGNTEELADIVKDIATIGNNSVIRVIKTENKDAKDSYTIFVK